jgi:glutamine synthetase
MTQQARIDAVVGVVQHVPRTVEYPRDKDGRPKTPSAMFGENVFSLCQLRKSLPKPVYAQFIKQKSGRQSLDKITADAVAHAVRIWAQDRGVCRIFYQPDSVLFCQYPHLK